MNYKDLLSIAIPLRLNSDMICFSIDTIKYGLEVDYYISTDKIVVNFWEGETQVEPEGELINECYKEIQNFLAQEEIELQETKDILRSYENY